MLKYENVIRTPDYENTISKTTAQHAGVNTF